MQITRFDNPVNPHFEYTKAIHHGSLKCLFNFFLKISYNIVCYSSPSVQLKIRRCSVVVITPDFDKLLQNFPATGVRLSAEPHFFHFLIVSLIFLGLHMIEVRQLSLKLYYDSPHRGIRWAAVSPVSLFLSQWQIFYLRVQPIVVEHLSHVFCM